MEHAAHMKFSVQSKLRGGCIFTSQNALLACLAALLTSVLTRAELPVAPPLFYAVISDTQKADNDTLTDFAWGAGQVAEIAPDFVLMPGDLTNTGSDNQFTNFMRVAAGLTGPVYYGVGNHEAPAGEHVYRARFSKYTGQQPYYHQQLGNWHLIMLDSVRFQNGKLQHDGEIDAEQMAWLKQELQGIDPQAPIFLSLHHPLIDHDGLVNRHELLKTLAKHYLVYTVTGHFHRNGHHQDANAIHHLVTGALSFSCSKKCGIGYRWISTVGRDLWTAWIETTDEPPLTLIHHEKSPDPLPAMGPMAQKVAVKNPVCMRLRYRGKGVGVLFGTQPHEEWIPPAGTGAPTVQVDSKAGTVLLQLPATNLAATAFVPLSEAAAKIAFAENAVRRLFGSAQANVTEISVNETTAQWDHYTLKKPGDTNCKVSLRYPRGEAGPVSGVIPILACLDGRPDGLEPELLIDGKLVVPEVGSFVAVVFDANGVQGNSHKFKNSLYVNDEFITLLPMDRDILTWEKLAYPLPRRIWEQEPQKPWFMLTAGTPSDGTGANPPANNEDYVVRNVTLFDGSAYLCDLNLPLGKGISIGDNSPKFKTFFKCYAQESVVPRDWQVVLHAWDTAGLTPGEHTIMIRLGSASASAAVTIE